jgi:hypothetical protein
MPSSFSGTEPSTTTMYSPAFSRIAAMRASSAAWPEAFCSVWW